MRRPALARPAGGASQSRRDLSYGWTDGASVDGLRTWIAGAGPWGYVLLLVTFALGELAHIPGLVFVFAAVLAYGQLEGGALNLFDDPLQIASLGHPATTHSSSWPWTKGCEHASP